MENAETLYCLQNSARNKQNDTPMWIKNVFFIDTFQIFFLTRMGMIVHKTFAWEPLCYCKTKIYGEGS